MAGFSIIRSRRAGVRPLVALAMVPLVVWSGMPARGCICADGHFEAVCTRHLHGASGAESNAASATRVCGSCHKESRAHEAACTATRSCCRQTAGVRYGDNSVSAASRGCCTPLVKAPAIAAVSVSPRAADDHHVPAVMTAALEAPCVLPSTHSFTGLAFDTGPPPDDLVVTLSRLLI